MKTSLLFVILFLNSLNINSQTLKLGVTANFLTGNKYYNYQAGPQLLAEYSFESMPFSIIGGVRLYISELSKEYLPGFENTTFGIGFSVNYYPINWKIQPYIGGGAFYYSNNIKAGGMPAVINGTIRSVRNVDNNFSAEVTGGIKFSATTPINFIVEITQTLSKSGELITSDVVNNRTIEKKEIKIFNSLFLKAGILLQI